jgi:hypothetical protein
MLELIHEMDGDLGAHVQSVPRPFRSILNQGASASKTQPLLLPYQLPRHCRLRFQRRQAGSFTFASNGGNISNNKRGSSIRMRMVLQ